MDFKFGSHGVYKIESPAQIHTPRLLVFKDRVENNIRKMKSILENYSPGSGFHHLCPHIKTNKSSYIVKTLLKHGVTSFKVSVNEAELAASCGAGEVFVAYPLLKHDADKIANLSKQYAGTRFIVQAGCRQHADILRTAARENGLTWNVLLDLDVGMHRTGSAPDEALSLYNYFIDWSELELIGLHGYDGHIHHPTVAEREKASEKAMKTLLSVVEKFKQQGNVLSRIIASGSPAFVTDLKFLAVNIPADLNYHVSPGTWIFWDSKYDGIIPGLFSFAALILAQVIESGNNRITLNLGHKRWAADQGAVDLFAPAGLTVRLFSEEHTVLEHDLEQSFAIGDYVLIVPKHVCPTVNLYDHFILIGAAGEILDEKVRIDGRNL